MQSWWTERESLLNDLRILLLYGNRLNEKRISQLPDGGLLFLLDWRTLPGCPERRRRLNHKRDLVLTCVSGSSASIKQRLRFTHLIISVHRTASCSSISLSLYWFLSISTRAISTRVNRRRCVIVMSPSCMGDENWDTRAEGGGQESITRDLDICSSRLH